MSLDTHRAYALHARVALRPEPFGALAYHYGNRRLTFLKSPDLVALVRDLGRHDSLDEAVEAHDPGGARRPSYLSALATLEQSEVIRAR